MPIKLNWLLVKTGQELNLRKKEKGSFLGRSISRNGYRIRRISFEISNIYRFEYGSQQCGLSPFGVVFPVCIPFVSFGWEEPHVYANLKPITESDKDRQGRVKMFSTILRGQSRAAISKKKALIFRFQNNCPRRCLTSYLF